ncbi:hypothetical protein FQN50_008166 [Emmonsiellopsis sp. PD_5]|nr:hypothetical protein FQN50_008166 [Emmonsiellopsis sp. PD_5]
MPRVTRAASRLNNALLEKEDPTKQPHVHSSDATSNTPAAHVTRHTLGEITGNSDSLEPPFEPSSTNTQFGLQETKLSTKSIPQKKFPQKERRIPARELKSAKDLDPDDLWITAIGNRRILEAGKGDAETSAIASQAEISNSQEGIKDSSPGRMPVVVEEPVSFESQSLGPIPPLTAQTPRFDPTVHKSPAKEVPADEDDFEDSFVQAIVTRSPSKSNFNGESASSTSMPHSSSVDYDQVEDPLDAIDALEDALEQIGQALPVVGDHGLDSPVRSGTPTEGGLPLHRDVPEHLKNRGNGTQSTVRTRDISSQRRPETDRQRPRTIDAKSTNPPSLFAKSRQSTVAPSQSTRSPVRSSNKAPRTVSDNTKSTPIHSTITRKSSHPTLPSNSASTPSTKTNKSRPHSTIISTQKPAFTPSKSTKPPTRPTFELPGEAISRRLKAQREERLKREEEELRQKREFKARKPRDYSTPSLPVKETVASRTRATRKADETQSPLGDNSSSPSSLLKNRQSSALMPTRTSSLRTASTGSTTSKRTASEETSAGGRSISVSPGTPRRPSTGSSRGLNSNGSPSKTNQLESPASSRKTPGSLSRADSLVRRSRGKEIFARDRIHERERDRERREKEEAAKRARAEAAERGRMASREWAERQKLKVKMARKSQSDLQRESQTDGRAEGAVA